MLNSSDLASDNPTFTSGDPTLVVICSWTGARLKHVRYYATTYRKLFPETPVMVVTTSASHFVLSDHRGRQAQVAGALHILKTHHDKNTTKARILIHALSNGGSYKACELARAYRDAYREHPPFPVVCLDSAPGIPRYLQDCRAVAKSLTTNRSLERVYRAPVFIVLSAVWARYHCFEDFENNPISRTYRDLLSDRFFQFGTRRCYLYSSNDDMVSCTDVEAHASAARGNYAVTEHVFDSAHVKHAKTHRDNYWSILHQTWTGLAEGQVIGHGGKTTIPLYHRGYGIYTSSPA